MQKVDTSTTPRQVLFLPKTGRPRYDFPASSGTASAGNRFALITNPCATPAMIRGRIR